jgi:energy-converting hydrogenase A subunit M
MNKKYLLYVITPILAFATVGAVYASSAIGENNNPMNDIVNAIAQKFNLNVSDVQQVFDEHRESMKAQHQELSAERQAEMQKKFGERLAQAVSDGKLTQEQADKIMAKKAELQTQRQNLQNGTPEENRENAKTHMDELKQWATDNNIPLEYLQIGGGGMGRMNPKFGGGMPNQIAE